MVIIGRGTMEEPPVSDCADSPQKHFTLLDPRWTPIVWAKVSNALVLHPLLVVYVLFLSPMREIVSRKIPKRQ
jgi:hypothetical protein